MMPVDLSKLEEGRGPDLVLKQLQKENGTTVELSQALKLKRTYVGSICTQLMQLGAIHIADWKIPPVRRQGVKIQAVYAFGAGESAIRPSLYGRQESRAAWRERCGNINYHGQGIGRVSSVFQLGGISEDRKDPET